jgi:hypothetical protein
LFVQTVVFIFVEEDGKWILLHDMRAVTNFKDYLLLLAKGGIVLEYVTVLLLPKVGRDVVDVAFL